MPVPAHAGGAPAAPRHERIVVLALCTLAALRVFFFSAVFPLFNNVDEASHFDLVRKYARGHVPRGVEPFDDDAARDILLYGSPEYMVAARRFPGGVVPPPVWTLPSDRVREALEIRARETATDLNYESTQPPLYYALAGAWWRLGEALGLRGGHALYWIRFMNVIVCALLVWLAYSFARTLLPDREFLRVAMPFLVAFFPQDALYSVSNDALVPLVGGAALWALFALTRGQAGGSAFHAGTGLLVAAAVLVKPSCVPVAFMALAAVVIAVLRAEAGKRRAAIHESAALLLAAGAPLAAWGLRNALVLGDVTGAGSGGPGICGGLGLGWSLKSLGTVFDHPLFSAGGLVTFWHETMTSFWRGEFLWAFRRIASKGWDSFYTVSSLVLPLASIVSMVVRRGSVAGEERRVRWLSLAALLLSLLFLAVVSVIFDFDGCYYPSRAHPFLTSGRLALAALLPFVALYLTGVQTLLPGRRTAPLRWALLVAVVGWMTFSEVSMSRGALHSAYNWFHLG